MTPQKNSNTNTIDSQLSNTDISAGLTIKLNVRPIVYLRNYLSYLSNKSKENKQTKKKDPSNGGQLSSACAENILSLCVTQATALRTDSTEHSSCLYCASEVNN